MKAKTINKIISRKLADWLRSIDDLELVKKIEKDVIFTGGCIASMLLKEEVNDFDVYFKTRNTAESVANYYIKKFNSTNTTSKAEIVLENDRIKIYIPAAGVATEDGNQELLESPFDNAVDALSEADSISMPESDEKEKYRVVFLSSNAITLSNDIQIVVRFYGDVSEIHKNYDFAHCTNYWTSESGLVLNVDALEALMTKELVYMGSKYPLCSIIRTRKFIKRGFHINAGQYLKMCLQLNELDLCDIQVLEDQLIGVDSSFFTMLINALKKHQEDNKDLRISATYVATIIDRIF